MIHVALNWNFKQLNKVASLVQLQCNPDIASNYKMKHLKVYIEIKMCCGNIECM